MWYLKTDFFLNSIFTRKNITRMATTDNPQPHSIPYQKKNPLKQQLLKLFSKV